MPGAVDGWFALHERFGRLPMTRVLGPAIGAARDGVPIPPVIAHYWGRNAAVLDRFEGFRRTFMPGGRAPQAGAVFRNPDLARTYERLARDGRAAFYEGPVAEAIDGGVYGDWMPSAEEQATLEAIFPDGVCHYN